jgi:Ca2+-transporting ATPase
MSSFQFHTTGLTNEQVEQARAKYGFNTSGLKSESGFLKALMGLVKEPMFILLLTASTIYFISGKTGDGFFMVCAIVLVATISLYQDSRSRNALQALKDLTQPFCKVIRNGVEVQIASEQLVVGDSVLVEEGSSIPADGIIIHANDFSVNESILTGESLAVSKSESGDNKIFQGTTVVTGLAICNVTTIGSETQLGKIGKRLEDIEEESTPLQIQITHFVKRMALIGSIVFLLVWFINFLLSKNLMDSLLKSLTLAMSILPEEIPVAFTTFMALGAWRLMKVGIIVKQTKTVETLGSATVICLDKTGTITENKMALSKLYTHASKKSSKAIGLLGDAEKELIRLAMWSSEPIPFDPMEIAMHKAYAENTKTDERLNFKLIHEYPLEGKPPMMTHVFENNLGTRIIAAKGAPEALINASQLTEQEKKEIEKVVQEFASEGYRVLGVGITQLVPSN